VSHVSSPVDAAVRRRRATRRATFAFLVSAGAAVALVVITWSDDHPEAEGVLLAVALGALAYGLVTWANRVLEAGPFIQSREPLATPQEVRTELADELERVGVSRRPLLVASLGLASGSILVALASAARSLGPNPGSALEHTPWKPGLRLVADDGTPIQASAVPMDGLVTVFPEGSPGSADGQAVLIRVDQRLLRLGPGRESWAPQGLIAYSKVCTHAGCPVGLYTPQTHELLCPCHQSSFAVLDGARPTSGPAAAPLPQLPLALAADGTIHATGDFSAPVGPGYWRRT
jgi:ubiquinol-cytochrome c reductase iron-sulfur subunit